MGLSHIVSEIDGRWTSKIAKFSHPNVFCVHTDGVSLGIACRHWGSKNYSDGATGPRKKFDDIFSDGDTMHQRDGWTDRQMDTGQQQRPCLCIFILIR